MGADVGLSVPPQVTQSRRSSSCLVLGRHALDATDAAVDEAYFNAVGVVAAGQDICNGSLHLAAGGLVDFEDDGDVGAGDDLIDGWHVGWRVASSGAASSSSAAASASAPVGRLLLRWASLAVARSLHTLLQQDDQCSERRQGVDNDAG